MIWWPHFDAHKSQHLVPKIRPFIAQIQQSHGTTTKWVYDCVVQKEIVKHGKYLGTSLGPLCSLSCFWLLLDLLLMRPSIPNPMGGMHQILALSCVAHFLTYENRLLWQLCLRLPWDILYTKTDRHRKKSFPVDLCPNLFIVMPALMSQNKHWAAGISVSWESQYLYVHKKHCVDLYLIVVIVNHKQQPTHTHSLKTQTNNQLLGLCISFGMINGQQ